MLRLPLWGRVLIATETSVIPNSSVIPTCLVCFLRLSKLEVFFAGVTRRRKKHSLNF